MTQKLDFWLINIKTDLLQLLMSESNRLKFRKIRRKEMVKGKTYIVIIWLLPGHHGHHSASKHAVDKVAKILIPPHAVSLDGVSQAIPHFAQLVIRLKLPFNCIACFLESHFKIEDIHLLWVLGTQVFGADLLLIISVTCPICRSLFKTWFHSSKIFLFVLLFSMFYEIISLKDIFLAN